MSVDTLTSSSSTAHKTLPSWVDAVAALTKPDRIHWVVGPDAAWEQITGELVEAGTLVKLDEDKKPNSFWAASDPADVARVERSEEHTSELQSRGHLVCRLLLEKKKKKTITGCMLT